MSFFPAPSDIPARHYEGVGRIAVAAGILEVRIALVAWHAYGRDQNQSSPFAFLGQPGGALRALDKAREVCQVDGLPELLAEARRVLNERNRIVHSVVTFGRDADGLFDPRAHAKGQSELEHSDLPTVDEYGAVERRILACADRTEHVLRQIRTKQAADSLRTEEENDE